MEDRIGVEHIFFSSHILLSEMLRYAGVSQGDKKVGGDWPKYCSLSNWMSENRLLIRQKWLRSLPRNIRRTRCFYTICHVETVAKSNVALKKLKSLLSSTVTKALPALHYNERGSPLFTFSGIISPLYPNIHPLTWEQWRHLSPTPQKESTSI